ncbi:uncharacterized protein LOC143445105 [Clavelina lepadiformis]|uniref:Tudor domain-containing protein n=1 Tax=Clavelina lepadiformis TaxID=159417 RepID=A0ABP0F9W6_CLALP
MKQWQQSHLIITATTIPIALLIGWWVYKKTVRGRKSSHGGPEDSQSQGSSPIDNSKPLRVEKKSLYEDVGCCSDEENIQVGLLAASEMQEEDTLTAERLESEMFEEEEGDADMINRAVSVENNAGKDSEDCVEEDFEEGGDCNANIFKQENVNQNEQTALLDIDQANISNDKIDSTVIQESVESSKTNFTEKFTQVAEAYPVNEVTAYQVICSVVTSSNNEEQSPAETEDEPDLNDVVASESEQLVLIKAAERISSSDIETLNEAKQIPETTDNINFASANELASNKGTPIQEQCETLVHFTCEVTDSDNVKTTVPTMVAPDQSSDGICSLESPLTSDSDDQQHKDTLLSGSCNSLNELSDSKCIKLQKKTSSVNGTNSNGYLLDNEKCDTDEMATDTIINSDVNRNNSNNVGLKLNHTTTNGNGLHHEECHDNTLDNDGTSTNNNEDHEESIHISQTNGWDISEPDTGLDTHEDSANGEDKESSEKKSSGRPKSLPYLSINETSTEDEDDKMQVHVEFPSELVGLLIGKMGRNIKQLKQDSGADVYVHAEPFRDDIQVLQICGTQSEVESCVSRIKRRFNEISLTPYDADKLKYASQENSSVGVDNSASQVLYPVPNISQLRLPDGITVEVIVSAIAAVDCVFLQQYTHPTFHCLDSLERAMALCYAEPSTPGLPNPVQVGLICAAPQQGLWYRAQIVQCFEETEEIQIKFMDYGGYATVAGKCIKQIRADLVTLPFQAVECYLDNIAPPEDNRFCEETVTKIAELLKEGRFQARVTGYRGDGHPRIQLFKCIDNEVIHINQEMATKGLATWIEPAPHHPV